MDFLRIKSTPNVRVPIKIRVIVPKLVVYHPNTTEDLTLIDFPPTIEKTCRYDTFVLRNLSSRASNYVVLGEIDNEVKFIRVRGNCFLQIKLKILTGYRRYASAKLFLQDIDCKQYPAYNAFKIHPLEGRLNPFQGIIFEVK